jgi:PAS domain S-box-containing protein
MRELYPYVKVPLNNELLQNMTHNIPLPDNERERLEALINFNILEKMPEQDLLPLIKLAGFIGQTSVAILSIIEGKRHYIKTKIGLSVYDLQNDFDFCHLVVQSNDYVEIPDAMKDAVFSMNPMVVGHPNFRFFGGVPIATKEGFNIGSICILDTNPKHLFAEQVETLKKIASQVTVLLELRKQNKNLQTELNQLIHDRINQTEIDLASYKFALDQSAEVAITDRDGFIKFANEKFCASSKYIKEELLGQPYKILNSGYHPQSFFSELWQTITKGNVWHGEIKNRNKVGNHYWVNCSIIPFLDKKGQPYQYIAIQHDVTEKKNALERLTIETRLISIVSENEGIESSIKKIAHQVCLHLEWDLSVYWSLDPKKNKLSNPKIYNHNNQPINEFEHQTQRTEYNKGEGLPGYVWVSKKPKWLVDLNDQPLLIDRSSIEESSMKSALVFPIIFKNEVIGVMEFFSFKLKKDDYNILQMIESFGLQIGAFIDRKVAEEELIKAKKEAEESVKSKDQFLTNMSHEIRTPMNAIIGFTQLILQTSLNSKQSEFANSVKIAAENLLSIINDILDFSKIESGVIKIESTPTDIRQTFKNVHDLLKISAAQKNLEFIIETDPSLPEAVLCDALRLNQILINLVGNAIKFTEKGSVKFSAEVVKAENSLFEIAFKVKDTGIGIIKEKQKDIFERFNQVNNDINRKYEGTGLGLSISKNLIELLGGKLEMQSEIGVGSEFSFNLYVLKCESDSITKKDLSNEKLSQTKNKSILLIEDNPLNQKLAKNVLNNFGFDVVIADNGLLGLEVLKHQKFDLILMDIQMPELDGYQTTTIIRRELKLHLPIIAMTAHSIVGEKEKCISVGMNEFISKPFNQKDLFDKISALIPGDKNISEVPNMTRPLREIPEINLNYLYELSNGNTEFEKEMISLFIHQVPKEILNLQRACEDYEYVKIAEIAHKLKSSMDIFNRHDLSESLSIIIEEARSNRITDTLTNKLEAIDTSLHSYYPLLIELLETKYKD